MKVTIWKNDNESNERAITRFNKKVQGSRKIIKIRSDRYHKKDATKRYARAAAIMRDHHRARKEKTKFY
ncbi:hypothetical protein HN709_01065 [Candidatus Peregrinibacteria bacterium]|nr:hypothetical protein [Candidatus Peregrinibacteria bacterium]MBT7736254.1 hypothetical protein [Candidatus Peregrinibacteria bacterium]